MSDWIPLGVKFKGKCAECGKEISVGERALWSKTGRTIKHIKCESLVTENKKEKMPEVPELNCFVCGRLAGCAECGFGADCDRELVSQACICRQCLEDEQSYTNYQTAFVEKAHRAAKVRL